MATLKERIVTKLLQHRHTRGALQIAIIGRTGHGKSTLVNRLVGKPVAHVSPHERGTTQKELHPGDMRGLKVRVIDTPGLGDEDEIQEARNLEIMSELSGSGAADVFVYVRALNAAPDDVDQIAIRSIRARCPEAFGQGAVVVFTKLDRVDRSRLHETASDWINTMRTHLTEYARLSAFQVRDVPITFVCDTAPEVLPVRDPRPVTLVEALGVAGDDVRRILTMRGWRL